MAIKPPALVMAAAAIAAAVDTANENSFQAQNARKTQRNECSSQVVTVSCD
jgi:hypothetical protein